MASFQSNAAVPSVSPGSLRLTGELLGTVGFGEVKKGLFSISGKNPLPVALKILSRLDALDELVKEAAIMRTLDHPNVLKCYGAVYDGKSLDSVGEPLGCCIVLELCNAGSLRKALDALKVQF